jgi:hypothetical protein
MGSGFRSGMGPVAGFVSVGVSDGCRVVGVWSGAGCLVLDSVGEDAYALFLDQSIPREAGAVLNESDIYREWAPPEAWREVVACCWEQRVHADRVQRVLPDGHADVLLYGSGEAELVGIYDHVALPVLPRGTAIRGIRLRPEAISPAFRLEASELRNMTVPAEDVIGARGARRLRDDHAVDAWIRSTEPDRRTAAAVELL